MNPNVNPEHREEPSAKTEAIDPLLQSLLAITKYYQRPVSARALTAGLPLEHHQLTLELFPRAAERADLSAQVNSMTLDQLSEPMLPAVLVLANHRACVLLEINGDAVKVIYPETGSGVTELSSTTLAGEYTGVCILIKPNYQFTRRSGETLDQSKKHWFWGVFVKMLPLYSEVLVAAALINVFGLAVPLFSMNIYDRVVPNYAIETMWVLASGVAIAFLFDLLMKTLRSYFIDAAAREIDMRLSASIFQQILGIQMAARPNSVGAFANSVQSFEIFRDFITSSSVTVLVDVPFIFLYILVIYLIGGALCLVPMIILPLAIFIGYLLQIPLTEMTKESYKHAAEKQATLIESLAGVEAIKTTGSESAMQKRWEQIVALSAKHGIKMRFITNIGINLAIFMQQLTTVIMVIAGVYLISDGKITTGALIACTILAGRAMAPVTQIANLLTRYFQSVNALESLDTIMKMPVDREPDARHLHRPHLEGQITFNNVTFSYPDSAMNAIHNVSFDIKPGERVAIIGKIGSGKSTIAKLLMKLYQPASGSILCDKTEYTQIDPADLRYNIGYVPQDIVLFYGSVKDNIAMGATHVSDEEFLRAARMTGVTRFTDLHPQGFDLQVGERGRNVSGGQRQSVVLARSFVLDPPILLLDEPTASMDDATESIVKQNLLEYMRHGKTLIIITHKASMLALVDRIIVMDSGRVVADGEKNAVLTALQQGNISVPKGKTNEQRS